MTPKEGWRNVDIAGFFADRFADTVGITTDVIGAALAEGRWGAAEVDDYAYVTVGTGVGVGLIAAANPYSAGTIRTRTHPYRARSRG